MYATLSLFGGIGLAFLMDYLLRKSNSIEFEIPDDAEEVLTTMFKENEQSNKSTILYNWIEQSEGVANNGENNKSIKDMTPSAIVTDVTENSINEPLITSNSATATAATTAATTNTHTHEMSEAKRKEAEVDQNLKVVGALTAIVITLHKIPEGIITYIGYVDDPVIGLTLAIGIAAHNIPEGLSVALPVFYATHNRSKAFLWCFASGLAEPFGAFLCMLFLRKFMNDYIFGFLFGVTGGIMTQISICELFPTGISFENDRSYTSYAFLFGIGFILISFILMYCVCSKIHVVYTEKSIYWVSKDELE